ncbi:MAG: Nif3-like dinuclear metal center hexameric protein [Symbiobacterium sp.]|uniref:Nif3-like dinuclear metal center hexameric protein n=1 Tax=Symbiobacterium sp. TaxID=1971213 RepID=UPI0034647511
MTTVGAIAAYIEELAPPAWAESWDNVGLQVGDPAAPVRRVLVALELTDPVLAEAEREECDLVVVHHPPIFRPLKALRFDSAPARRLQRLILKGIALYAAHTNLDQAPGMTNDSLAVAAGLTAHRVLRRAGEERYLKLVVFVPRGHEDAVLEALAGAGAGHIGNYSHCTFQAPGTGTFLPLEGTNPFIGQQGRLERADEVRLETIVPESAVDQAVRAMLAAHPYEEVAYDLYPLANPGRARGHGRIGRLEQPVSLAELAERLKSALSTPCVRVVGDPERRVTTVAVGAGAGSDLIRPAAGAGADVLVTGDVRYHEAQDALDLGLAVIDVGHYNAEAIAVRPLAAYLRERLARDGAAVEVREAQAGRDPFRFM